MHANCIEKKHEKMASIKLILDRRNVKVDRTSPIYLRLIHNRKTMNLKLGLYLEHKHWNKRLQQVKKTHQNHKRWNISLQNKLIKAEKILLDYDDDVNNKSADELKNLIELELFPNKKKALKKKKMTLKMFCKKIVLELKKAGKDTTAMTYHYDIKSFIRFNNGKDMYLEHIDYDYLKSFEADTLGRGISVNGLAHYMKTLRSLMNRAIKSGILDPNHYPFRFYSIKTQKTIKRAIDKKYFTKIQELDFPVESKLWHTQNYILFMFNTQGMNFKDVAILKTTNINENRIVYIRQKTKRVYSIKITKKAQEIIDYYQNRFITYPHPKKLLFPILPIHYGQNTEQDAKLYYSALKYMNDNCNTIGQMIGLNQPLTTYVIRHSWATIGKKMGIPTNVLQEALGHSDLATTEAYLDCFEDQVVDEANELISN